MHIYTTNSQDDIRSPVHDGVGVKVLHIMVQRSHRTPTDYALPNPDPVAIVKHVYDPYYMHDRFFSSIINMQKRFSTKSGMSKLILGGCRACITNVTFSGVIDGTLIMLDCCSRASLHYL